MTGDSPKTALDELLRRATALPTLPSVAIRVLELGEDPYAGLSEVAGVVANDPVLSARLLKAANSPLYAARRQIDNLRQAVSLLGFNTAITLALSFSLEPPDNGDCVDKQAYWRRSLAAAVASRVLAEQLHGGESGRFFLAALLQDIGMLVLEKAEPERYARMLRAAHTHADLAQAETQVFGFDHAQVGSHLLESWRVPEALWRAVRCSHELGAVGAPVQTSQLDRCVHFSGLLADFWLLGPESRPDTRELAQWAEIHLGLDAEGFEAVLSRIAALLPDYAALFEIKLVQEHDVTALLAEARDVLLLRNLKTLQEAGEYKARNEMLESRNRVLEQQTYSDPLTGLLNRGRLNEILGREFAAAGSEGWPLSVGFVDVDYFKRINDGYGHQAGDVALVSIARALTEQMRQTDIVGRYGGEEFVVVLPGTSEEDAFSLLERLRQRLSELHLAVDHSEVSITVSIGLATYLTGRQPGDDMSSADDLMRAADRALYAAKREGRNRTVIYQRSEN
ncbi:sensor domain-containing diguanylate cyclase [Acidihalobacter prosperus]